MVEDRKWHQYLCVQFGVLEKHKMFWICFDGVNR